MLLPRKRVREAGWALMFVLFLSAALVISLAAVLPRAAFETQRDHEADLMFRGKDYARGIQLYFRKFKKYPSRMEDLENTNQVRFLRNRWRDPITGSDEWRLIHIGPAGVLVDSVLTAPGGVPGLPGSGPLGPGGAPPPAGTIGGVNTPTPGPVGGTTLGSGSSFGSGSGFGSGGSSFGSGGSSFGSGSSFGGGRPGGAGQGGTSTGFGGGSSGFGGGSSGFGGGLGSSSGVGTSVGGTTSGFAPAGTPTGLGGAQFGAGIAGVASKSEKQSIRLYNGRQKYNEWEFVYDYRRDPVLTGQVGATGPVGTNLPTSTPFGNQPGGTGSTFSPPGGTGSTIGQPPRPIGPPR